MAVKQIRCRATVCPTANGRTESRHSTNRTHDVYGSNGQYISSDPDPRVRMDILRDHGYDD